MTHHSTSDWLKVCLYYSEPLDEFLAKAVKPYTDVISRAGIVEMFYFERNHAPRPHICLYFKGNTYILEHLLKPNLHEHFQQYLESHPSPTLYPYHSPDTDESSKNATGIFFQYSKRQPMFEGYTSSVCEEQFQASSLFILKLLRDKTEDWTFWDMFNTAIRLHLSLAYAIGMKLEEAQQFFQFLFDDWQSQYRNTTSASANIQSSEDTRGLFQKDFDHHKMDFVSYHAALWELFKNYRQVEDEAFIDWVHSNTRIAVELQLAPDSGGLGLSINPVVGFLSGDPKQPSLWNIYSIFIRQTSNRLGIQSKIEGYLYFVISKSLQLLMVKFPSAVRV